LARTEKAEYVLEVLDICGVEGMEGVELRDREER
jgi:hypothetical protein